MFWVCLISRRDTSPRAKTRRDPRSATLATDRTVIKNWRPNRLNLRLLTLPQTLKEASSCPLGTATSLSHRGIFSHRLNVKLNSSVSFFNAFVLWQKLSDCQLPHFFFFFLAIPAEDKVSYWRWFYMSWLFFCEGMWNGLNVMTVPSSGESWKDNKCRVSGFTRVFSWPTREHVSPCYCTQPVHWMPEEKRRTC